MHLSPPHQRTRALHRTAHGEDQRVFLHDLSWEQYERLLATRGERSVPRIAFLDGELELMRPSVHHEWYKTATARLLEAFALERGLSLNGYGSWTVKSKRRKCGTEPDECYVLGAHQPVRPDLAIEIGWSRDGIDKLEIYRRLGVREVWLWRGGAIEVHALRGDRYARRPKSKLLPDLDLVRLATFARESDQTRAVRRFVAWLGRQRKSSPGNRARRR